MAVSTRSVGVGKTLRWIEYDPIMKMPERLEEYLVWRPLGVGSVTLVGSTLYPSLVLFHETVAAIEGGYLMAAYLFPVAMGVVFGWRLEGKYWLGFVWVGFLLYCGGLVLSLVALDGLLGHLYVVVISCAIMFAVQSFILFYKRFGQDGFRS